MSHRATSAESRRGFPTPSYIGLALALVALDLLTKWQVERALGSEGHIELGIIELRIGHNSGVAFGLGASLPGWLVLGITSLIALGVGVLAWWYGPSLGRLGRAGLTSVTAGAVANIVDRAVDGRVTDFLYTGWFATFNVADALIVCGAVAVVLATWRSQDVRE